MFAVLIYCDDGFSFQTFEKGTKKKGKRNKNHVISYKKEEKSSTKSLKIIKLNN